MRFYQMQTDNEVENNNRMNPYNNYRNPLNRPTPTTSPNNYQNMGGTPLPMDRVEDGWYDPFVNYDPSYKLPIYNGFTNDVPPLTPITTPQNNNLSAETLTLIKNAIEGEKEDERFYDDLINMAPKQEDKDIITSIRNDERNHNQYFRKIYKDFTGEDVQAPSDIEYEKPATYAEGLKKALFGELTAVEKYRKIRKELTSEQDRDVLFEIITDELKHSGKYNYLYNTANK